MSDELSRESLPATTAQGRKPVLVTGATGYIGGRLVPRLLAEGWRVRCLVRDARKIAIRDWAQAAGVEVVEGDASRTDFLIEAMSGCGAAYYLIHSMIAAGPDYRERDRHLAASFAEAAEQAGLERIIYLGGLGEMGSGLSKHLSSRREVESALSSGATPVTVLRAAMIIGSGSASFEILRYLVERLPAMITPRWVGTECQPIAVQNALHYLAACLEVPETLGRTLDIGGPERLSYREIMQQCAAALGLRRRLILPVPVLTPRLSSLWIHLVTPADHRIARPLAEGLRNRVVCRDDEALRLMPQRLLTVREAIEDALAHQRAGSLETSCYDAGPVPGDTDWSGGTVFEDRRSREVQADAQAAFRALCRIGGREGWYGMRGLWRLRAFLDRLLGGPGGHRGRRDAERVAYGDVIDSWRVTRVEAQRALELRAEMRLPGVAELAFSIEPLAVAGAAGCRVIQRARFKPRGLGGILYWYAVKPFHSLVFRGMLAGLCREAERIGREPATQIASAVSPPRPTS